MLRSTAGIRQPLRILALGLSTLIVATAVTAGPADAKRRHRAARAPAVKYEPAYASIVVDANTGAVLQAADADSPRHPASLTKIMTLYLLFERLESGKIKLNTPMEVSAHAASQAPSKLGLKPGDVIAVEPAIRAIVTKSANDVAVVVAEALAGSEPDFARMMTKKAREIGMANTTYRNASGLPDEEQITTARDMIALGRSIQERFPTYYKYFSTRSFEFRGHAMRNHNKLLGQVEGVDGIKTGYTNASGFNLITSAKRGGKHIVAAVFGGRTGSWRDNRMVGLIEKYFPLASAKKALVASAEAKEAPAAKEATKEPVKEQAIASAGPALPVPAAAARNAAAPAPGSTDPIKPIAVKTVLVKAAAVKDTLMANSATPQRLTPPTNSKDTPVTNVATVKSESTAPLGAKPGVLGVLSVPAGTQGAAPAPNAKVASADATTVPIPTSTASAAPGKARGNYVIQVGAFDDEAEAKERLAAAQKAAKDMLGGADPFTERASKNNKTIYRARFAGLDKQQAEAACSALRRGEIPCMELKN
jgi:D-alanyl-D-alanine carboxypeptidase